MLEAMATGLPVIATEWGGPVDYIDSTCGILVSSDGKERFIEGLARAMERLLRDPELGQRMGREGFYTWQGKIDSVLDYYRRCNGTIG